MWLSHQIMVWNKQYILKNKHVSIPREPFSPLVNGLPLIHIYLFLRLSILSSARPLDLPLSNILLMHSWPKKEKIWSDYTILHIFQLPPNFHWFFSYLILNSKRTKRRVQFCNYTGPSCIRGDNIIQQINRYLADKW